MRAREKNGMRGRARTLVLATALMLWLSPARPARAEALAPAFPDSSVRRWQTGLVRADRLEHASLAFSSGLAVGVVSRRPVAAAAGALALGLAKEVYDRRRTSFDRGDLLADAIGAALAALATDSLGR
jgi:hypothetical protein